MTPVDPTSGFGTEPLTPPPGVTLDSPEKEQVYRAALEFERFFVREMLKGMEKAGSSMPGEEENTTGALGGYRDMAQDQLTEAVLDGGGLGLASTLYGQLAEQLDGQSPAGAVRSDEGERA